MEGGETRSGYERLTAEEMDEQRIQSVAYQYLCHLEEAKRWMEACLNEELPAPTELEEGLRNGVLLAKLGHCFAPHIVPLKKIYDCQQERYKATGLHFRHTDNINHWRNAMAQVGLPSIFHPETTDIYDKKNMPRAVYCIHALSLYLFRLGLAPQIQDLYGKVKFTEEEINNMKRELDKYGIQLPAFSKIGGILAGELSVDEAAVHAAVIAINEAVERGSVEDTALALRNPNAMLLNLSERLAPVYQEMLHQARAQKNGSATNRYKPDASQEKDIYEEYLTQAEIQDNINQVNVSAALERVDDALDMRDGPALHAALHSPSLALRGLHRELSHWYLEQLALQRQHKALDLGCVEPLDQEELQEGVSTANENAQRSHAMEQAVSRIHAALRQGIPRETVKELMDPDAELPDVYPFAAELYQRELTALQAQNPQGALLQEELFVAVEMLSAVALINQALEAGDANGFWRALISPAAGLADIEEGFAQRYFDELCKLRTAAPRQGTALLSWNELQAGLNNVNLSVQEEHDQIVSIGLVNQALEKSDPQSTLAALLLPSTGLAEVLPANARHYHDVLTRAKKRKAQESRDPGAELWLAEIQEGVRKANQDTHTALKMSLGLAAVNQAVKEGRSSQTLNVLLLPALGFCSVVPECAPHYQSELAALMKARLLQGENRSPWVRHTLRESGSYYFHLHNFQGTWEQPKGFIQNSTHLSRDEIQSILTRVSAAHDRDCLWRASEPFVTRLQARGRGYLLRTQLAIRRHFLHKQLPAVLAIQCHWRRYLQQRRYQQRLQFLQENTHAALKIQACARMWLARRRYLARLRHFRSNVKSVIKIQAFFRANKAREDYRMLVGRQAPPLSVVRRFAHLLERGEADLLQERELLRLREEVVRSIRANQGLESDLAIMDLKIGLLVRNRITLQEVVSHCKKLTRKNKEQLSDMMALDKQKGLKSLSKEKREKLEAYQHLFYLLQTQPIFLSRLIFQMPVNKSTRFMESVIFTVYNYASDSREACLLLQLFSTALQEEIRSRVDRIQDIVTGNPTVIRLLVSFYRNARGQNALREILGPPVKEVLQDKTLNIQTDPVDIYKSWINQTESQTGQRSSLPYAVTPEQALSHAEVQRRLDIAVRILKSTTDRFLHAITSNLDSLPYGMRYTAKVLKDSLLEKFTDATEEEVYKIVGNLLYYRYMNPAVVAPDGFDIVDYSAGVVLHPDHRRTLGSIARVLQHAAANKLFQGDSAHLRSLNDYISHTHLRFRRFLRAACEVPSTEERFSVDEYSEMVTLNKPVIYITIAELINTHKLLLEHRDSVAPDHTGPLHELLADLGDVPTVLSLAGEGVGNPSDPDAEQTLAQCSRMEISLTLTNKFDIFKDDEDKPDARGLMLSTKQLIIDVIRTQPGDSLPLLLRTSASEDQEAEHWRMMQRRALRDARTPEKMKRNKSIVADDNLSLEEKKRKIHRNLRKLEAMGALHYQSRFTEILTDIAKDIRNQRRYRQRRQAELVKLRHTLQGLNCKSAFHSEQIDYYNQYIKTCLDKLAARGRVNGKKAGEGRGKQVKPASLNYTAARLYEKGVLLEIEDLPVSQFKNVIFDIIPCEEGGTFQVKARFMGVDMEKFPLHYQDLLQLQYEGVAVMKMFHKAKVNVNLLIFLLNKKFFKK
ncbi:ras GTPase-activating-like protein IQGAP3 [Acipenser oxyrinchus oxyrinchus]|uniref:Ras GTPase-activating-like protein IQGAP3 n=1 Tax=Acipenser oxyrinchus oxyrinchus TaxID=40147 RepID=A0AAD8CHM2_ACIOX|nr:ras GTPase-activating-like protein IQGAP3 [Acipenser oxyrinchus oxyrinchus]